MSYATQYPAGLVVQTGATPTGVNCTAIYTILGGQSGAGFCISENHYQTQWANVLGMAPWGSVHVLGALNGQDGNYWTATGGCPLYTMTSSSGLTLDPNASGATVSDPTTWGLGGNGTAYLAYENSVCASLPSTALLVRADFWGEYDDTKSAADAAYFQVAYQTWSAKRRANQPNLSLDKQPTYYEFTSYMENVQAAAFTGIRGAIENLSGVSTYNIHQGPHNCFDSVDRGDLSHEDPTSLDHSMARYALSVLVRECMKGHGPAGWDDWRYMPWAGPWMNKFALSGSTIIGTVTHIRGTDLIAPTADTSNAVSQANLAWLLLDPDASDWGSTDPKRFWITSQSYLNTTQFQLGFNGAQTVALSTSDNNVTASCSLSFTLPNPMPTTGSVKVAGPSTNGTIINGKQGLIVSVTVESGVPTLTITKATGVVQTISETDNGQYVGQPVGGAADGSYTRSFQPQLPGTPGPNSTLQHCFQTDFYQQGGLWTCNWHKLTKPAATAAVLAAAIPVGFPLQRSPAPLKINTTLAASLDNTEIGATVIATGSSGTATVPTLDSISSPGTQTVSTAGTAVSVSISAITELVTSGSWGVFPNGGTTIRGGLTTFTAAGVQGTPDTTKFTASLKATGDVVSVFSDTAGKNLLGSSAPVTINVVTPGYTISGISTTLTQSAAGVATTFSATISEVAEENYWYLILPKSGGSTTGYPTAATNVNFSGTADNRIFTAYNNGDILRISSNSDGSGVVQTATIPIAIAAASSISVSYNAAVTQASAGAGGSVLATFTTTGAGPFSYYVVGPAPNYSQRSPSVGAFTPSSAAAGTQTSISIPVYETNDFVKCGIDSSFDGEYDGPQVTLSVASTTTAFITLDPTPTLTESSVTAGGQITITGKTNLSTLYYARFNSSYGSYDQSFTALTVTGGAFSVTLTLYTVGDFAKFIDSVTAQTVEQDAKVTTVNTVAAPLVPIPAVAPPTYCYRPNLNAFGANLQFDNFDKTELDFGNMAALIGQGKGGASDFRNQSAWLRTTGPYAGPSTGYAYWSIAFRNFVRVAAVPGNTSQVIVYADASSEVVPKGEPLMFYAPAPAVTSSTTGGVTTYSVSSDDPANGATTFLFTGTTVKTAASGTTAEVLQVAPVATPWTTFPTGVEMTIVASSAVNLDASMNEIASGASTAVVKASAEKYIVTLPAGVTCPTGFNWTYLTAARYPSSANPALYGRHNSYYTNSQTKTMRWQNLQAMQAALQWVIPRGGSFTYGGLQGEPTYRDWGSEFASFGDVARKIWAQEMQGVGFYAQQSPDPNKFMVELENEPTTTWPVHLANLAYMLPVARAAVGPYITLGVKGTNYGSLSDALVNFTMDLSPYNPVAIVAHGYYQQWRYSSVYPTLSIPAGSGYDTNGKNSYGGQLYQFDTDSDGQSVADTLSVLKHSTGAALAGLTEFGIDIYFIPNNATRARMIGRVLSACATAGHFIQYWDGDNNSIIGTYLSDGATDAGNPQTKPLGTCMNLIVPAMRNEAAYAGNALSLSAAYPSYTPPALAAVPTFALTGTTVPTSIAPGASGTVAFWLGAASTYTGTVQVTVPAVAGLTLSASLTSTSTLGANLQQMVIVTVKVSGTVAASPIPITVSATDGTTTRTATALITATSTAQAGLAFGTTPAVPQIIGSGSVAAPVFPASGDCAYAITLGANWAPALAAGATGQVQHMELYINLNGYSFTPPNNLLGRVAAAAATKTMVIARLASVNGSLVLVSTTTVTTPT